MPAARIAALDSWIARQQAPQPSRPEAIRRLVEQALGGGEVRSENSLDLQIADQEAAIARMPKQAGPSPEAGMATMNRAMAENDLIDMKNQRTRRKNAKRNAPIRSA